MTSNMKTRRTSIAISLVLGLGVAACQGGMRTGKGGPSDAGQGGSTGDVGLGSIGTGGITGSGGSPTGGTGGIIAGGSSGGSPTGGTNSGGIIGGGGSAIDAGSAGSMCSGLPLPANPSGYPICAPLATTIVCTTCEGRQHPECAAVCLSAYCWECISGGLSASGSWSLSVIDCPMNCSPPDSGRDGSGGTGGRPDGEGGTGGIVGSGGSGGIGGSFTGGRSTGGSGGLGGVVAGGTTPTGGAASTGGSINTKLVANAVVAGSGYTCALLSGGTVRCWGNNRYGMLGDGTTDDSSLPVAVSGIANATAVSAGSNQACAVLTGGTVQCWGYNDYGQLGNGTATSSSVPVTVSGITNAAAASTGEYHTCVLLTGGTVQCWGWNSRGQLGNSSTDTCNIPNISQVAGAPLTVPVPCSQSPVTASGITNASAVVAGYWHSCALLRSGMVQCWGDNMFGQLGNGTTTASLVPVTVSGITNATAVAGGTAHTCALLLGGTVQCWGDNGSGELGNGVAGIVEHSSVPVTVLGISNATAISAGTSNSCAVLTGGKVQCWGDNYAGQLGIGTTSLGPGISTPVTVSGITNASTVAVGGIHACALLSAGTVQCWGSNVLGELGNGSTTNSYLPVTVSGF